MNIYLYITIFILDCVMNILKTSALALAFMGAGSTYGFTSTDVCEDQPIMTAGQLPAQDAADMLPPELWDKVFEGLVRESSADAARAKATRAHFNDVIANCERRQNQKIFRHYMQEHFPDTYGQFVDEFQDNWLTGDFIRTITSSPLMKSFIKFVEENPRHTAFPEDLRSHGYKRDKFFGLTNPKKFLNVLVFVHKTHALFTEAMSEEQKKDLMINLMHPVSQCEDAVDSLNFTIHYLGQNKEGLLQGYVNGQAQIDILSGFADISSVEGGDMVKAHYTNFITDNMLSRHKKEIIKVLCRVDDLGALQVLLGYADTICVPYTQDQNTWMDILHDLVAYTNNPGYTKETLTDILEKMKEALPPMDTDDSRLQCVREILQRVTS